MLPSACNHKAVGASPPSKVYVLEGELLYSGEAQMTKQRALAMQLVLFLHPCIHKSTVHVLFQ